MASERSILYLSFILLLFFFAPGSALAIDVSVSATVPGCGDGAVGPGEECDGTDLDGASCVSRGFSGGSLSCSASCTLVTSACSSGGGVALLPPAPVTFAVFEGTAYPESPVILLQDGQIAGRAVASRDATFQIVLSGLSGGNYVFGLYAEGQRGVKSPSFAFPLRVVPGLTTKVSGIRIPPVPGPRETPLATPPSFPQTPALRPTFLRADLNSDWRVNLIDLSIAAYWYRRALSPSFRKLESERLSGDGKIDLVDFSIMAYHWTG